MKAYGGSGYMDPDFLDLGISWRWSASRPCCFSPQGKSPRYPLDRSWVATEPVYTTWRRNNCWPYRESNSDPSVVQPVASLFLRCRNCVFKYLDEFNASKRRDNVVGIATGYGLDDRGVGVRVSVGTRFLPPQCLDQLWGPPSFLSNGYQGLFPRG
jgi:hypothetical protein